MIRPVIALAFVLIGATTAHAYTLTCNEYRSLVLSGDPAAAYVTSGYASGAVDFYAGLACFVGQSNCECLQNVFVRQPSALGGEVARQISRYIANGNGNSSAWAPMVDAARVICR